MKLENLSKIYNMKNEDIIALDNINYEFLKGKFYAIMGHSGSGKSTLIKILGLTLEATTGKYTIEDKDVNKLNDEKLSYYRMKYIGFIFQDFYLDDYMRAYENVMLPMLINKEIKRDERKERAINLLKKVGLENRIEHMPKELSGGEKQRVAIARALANNPTVILADEPTGNLDEENEKIIFETLKSLANEGKCIIVVSHSNIVKEYADIIINISKGKLTGEE